MKFLAAVIGVHVAGSVVLLGAAVVLSGLVSGRRDDPPILASAHFVGVTKMVSI